MKRKEKKKKSRTSLVVGVEAPNFSLVCLQDQHGTTKNKTPEILQLIRFFAKLIERHVIL